MSSTPTLPAAGLPAAHKDRSTGLVVFGVLAVIIGAFSGCFAFLPALGQAGAAPANPGSALMAGLLYGCFAIFMVASGIASIRRHRWSRPLLLIAAWTGLVSGVLGMAAVLAVKDMIKLLILGAMPSNQEDAAALFPVVVAVCLAAIGVAGVLVPGLFILFYSRRDVRATLEAADPNPSWTERVPMSVLGLSLGMGLGALSCLVVAINGALALFGAALVGPAAFIIGVLFAAVLGALAVGTYRLRVAAWWGTLLVSMVGFANGVVGLLSPEAMLAAAAPALQGSQLETMRTFLTQMRTPAMAIMAVLTIGWVTFLVAIKQHFKPRAP